MRSDKKCFCCKSNFCGKTCFFNFFRKKIQELQKNSDFLKKGCFKKSKYDGRTLLKNIRSQKIRKEILGGICLTSGFCFQKKGELDLVRKNTIEKNNQKKGRNKKKR